MTETAKIAYDTLSIEVTRRSNMKCGHCMHGEPQNIDLDLCLLDKHLALVSCINSILFTGGEPTLNVKAIQETLRMVKEKHIPVYSFYLITNGKSISDEFLHAMLDWYSYAVKCGADPEICGLTCSFDKYHEAVDPDNNTKMEAFSFYRPNDKKYDFDKYAPINLGRAREHHLSSREVINEILTVEKDAGSRTYTLNGVVTFTAAGHILSGCNYEYDNEATLSLGTDDDPEGYIRSIGRLA